MKATQVVREMPQLNQTQNSLIWQLILVSTAAVKLGCYDAADVIGKLLDQAEPKTPEEAP